MGPTPPVALPPVTAEYGSTLEQAGGQFPAAQSRYRFSRAADGKTRVDSGNMSVISNPAAAQTIVLDHEKKTATIQPSPSPAPPNPGMPQMPNFSPPGLPGQPHVPAVKVEDLGKTVLQGHEVEGKRFVIPPLAPPKPPAFQMPVIPKTPQMPGMPPAPPASQLPATTEVWNSTRMGVPILTKMSGSFGQLTQVCHSAVPGEPHPSAFQIPQGYKVMGTGA